MTLLIVDDEADLRDSMRDLFEDEGYVVRVAGDGAEAMMQLQNHDLPCAVILDIVMPGMDGVQVWTAMQQDARLANVPVVITTSDPSRAPTGVLTMRKPINFDVLMSAIRVFCPH